MRMKAKELAELLMENPDFEIDVAINDPDGSRWGTRMRTFDVMGICDIGYSDKLIRLDVKETD